MKKKEKKNPPQTHGVRAPFAPPGYADVYILFLK